MRSQLFAESTMAAEAQDFQPVQALKPTMNELLNFRLNGKVYFQLHRLTV